MMRNKTRNLFRLLLDDKRSVAMALVWAFAYICVRAPLPFLYAYLIDQVLPLKEVNPLLTTVTILIGCIVLAGAANYRVQIITATLRFKVMKNLKQSLYQSIQRVPYKNYINYMSGDLTSRVTSDLDELKYLLPDGIVLLIRDIILSIGLVVLMLMLNWRLSLISLALIPLFSVFVKSLAHQLNRLSKESYEKRGLVKSVIQEHIEGMRDIQVNNAYNHHTLETNKHIEASERASVNVAYQQAKMELALISFSVIGSIILWGIGGYGVLSNWITIGQIVAFSYAYNYFFEPLSNLVMAFGHIQIEQHAFQRIHSFINEAIVDDKENAEPITGLAFNQAIRFKDVSFDYSKEKVILKHCSFEIKPQQVTAIMGTSGSGKTTILSLLLKLIAPNEGTIRLGEKDIQAIPLDQWRNNIGLVPQDVFIFHGTLSENILMGRMIDSIELEKVCRLSGVSEMMANWDNSLETVLLEKGKNLSGGQRQKIAIARALVGNPTIMILDEPSNNLDEDARVRIRAALALASQGKTIILVTHDKELLEGVEIVYELKNGRLQKGGDKHGINRN